VELWNVRHVGLGAFAAVTASSRSRTLTSRRVHHYARCAHAPKHSSCSCRSVSIGRSVRGGLGVDARRGERADAAAPAGQGQVQAEDRQLAAAGGGVLGLVGGQQPKLYGIAGYTPITIKVPKGPVKIVLELSGFKPFEQVLDVRKNTTISPTLGAGARAWRS
jgi:hypothetical protein